MAACFNCGKTTSLGRSHTHKRGVAGGRWKKRAPKTNRLFRANLQSVTIILDDGAKKQVKLCTKCIKRIKKDIVDGKKPFFQLAHLEMAKKEKSSEVTATAN